MSPLKVIGNLVEQCSNSAATSPYTFPLPPHLAPRKQGGSQLKGLPSLFARQLDPQQQREQFLEMNRMAHLENKQQASKSPEQGLINFVPAHQKDSSREQQPRMQRTA